MIAIIMLFIWGINAFARMQIWEILALFMTATANAIFAVYLAYILPLKKEKKANDKAKGLEFFEGPIIAGKLIEELFFLPFKSYTEIYINWDDDSSLKELLESKIYAKYLVDLTKEEEITEFRKKKPSPVLDQMSKDLVKNLEDQRKELKTKIKKQPMPSGEDLKKLKEKEDALNKIKTTMLSFRESFNLQSILPLDKEELKKLHFYFCQMPAPERFSFEEYGFENTLVVTNDEWSRVLRTKPNTGFFEGWEVNLKSLNVVWILWFYMSENIPVLYLRFSNNMIEEEIDSISNMRAIVQAYVQLKIMEKWNYYLSNRPEQLAKENEMLKQRMESFEAGFESFVQKQANDNLIYSEFLENKVQTNLLSDLSKERRKKQLLGLSVVFLLVLFALFFLIILSGTSGSFKINPLATVSNFVRNIIFYFKDFKN
jgi:hypothetical protein